MLLRVRGESESERRERGGQRASSNDDLDSSDLTCSSSEFLEMMQNKLSGRININKQEAWYRISSS